MADSAIAILTFNRVVVLKNMLEGMFNKCRQYPIAIFDDRSQDTTPVFLKNIARDVAKALKTNVEVIERPDLLATLYKVGQLYIFLGTRNLGVSGNSNRALKWFMDETKAKHLCLCNDDIEVLGDFPAAYSRGHDKLKIHLFCFCVAGHTHLITRDRGLVQIKDVVDQDVEIWNGQKWAKVTPHKTGENQKLIRVTLSDGSYLDCTLDHRFSIVHFTGKDRFLSFKEVKACDLVVGDRCEPTSIDGNFGTIRCSLDSYTLGFLVGDGHVYQEKVQCYLYGDKIGCPLVGTRTEEHGRVRVTPTIQNHSLIESLKSNTTTLKELFLWDRNSILEFIAGLADSDGSNTYSGGIRISISKFERAQILQLLLTRTGIKSSLCLDRKAGTETNFGPLTDDLYYLQITECQDIPCHRLTTTNGHSPKFKGKYQTVRSIEVLEGEHDTFCFTEHEQHKAVFSNVLTHQCDFTSEQYRWTHVPVKSGEDVFQLKLLPRMTGMLMSITRQLVERIGYYNTNFGPFGEEHSGVAGSKVLMADYTQKNIEDVKTGDEVLAWHHPETRLHNPPPESKWHNPNPEQFTHRRLCKAKVAGTLKRIAPVVKITLASGKELFYTDDHKWMDGLHPERDYRVAKEGMKLMKISEIHLQPELTDDYKMGYIKGSLDGDGSYMDNGGILRVTQKEFAQRFWNYANDLQFVTSWNEREVYNEKFDYSNYIYFATIRGGREVALVLLNWQPTNDEHWRGWLAGMYDAEGCNNSIGQSLEANPDIYEKIQEGLDRFGFKYRHTPQRHELLIDGGRPELFRFLALTQPALPNKADKILLTSNFNLGLDKIVTVEAVGDMEVYSIKTTTGNYVADGYASRNCDFNNRARFAGGIKIGKRWLHCVDIEMGENPPLKSQVCDTSVKGETRSTCDTIAHQAMNYASAHYRVQDWHIPFNLLPTMAPCGLEGTGIDYKYGRAPKIVDLVC